MEHGVSRGTLMIAAGIVWTIAGANILRIGITSWCAVPTPFTVKLAGALVIFIAFYFGIFSRMYSKHSQRILQKTDNNCPFAFLDVRGWLIMTFMIGLGVTIRHYSLVPQWFIAMFYTGLSTALIITGVRFAQAARSITKRD